MPSVDQVGRYYPLMIAATCPEATPEQMVRHGAAWLDAADDAGRVAIADSLTSAQLAMLIPPPPDLLAAQESTPPHALQPRSGAGCWWTEGAPLGARSGAGHGCDARRSHVRHDAGCGLAEPLIENRYRCVLVSIMWRPVLLSTNSVTHRLPAGEQSI